MKLLLLTIPLLLSFTLCAQTGVPVSLTKKDGTVIETRLTGRSQTALIVSGGKINFTDLSSLSFESHDEAYDNLIELLTEYGVTIDYNYKPSPKSPLLQQQAQSDVVIYGLDKFRKQRAAGKTLQLLGIIASTATVVLQQVYTKQYQDDYASWSKTMTGPAPTQKTIGPALPIAGGAMMFIGFTIDLGAGKHLRL